MGPVRSVRAVRPLSLSSGRWRALAIGKCASSPEEEETYLDTQHGLLAQRLTVVAHEGFVQIRVETDDMKVLVSVCPPGSKTLGQNLQRRAGSSLGTRSRSRWWASRDDASVQCVAWRAPRPARRRARSEASD